MQAAHGGPRLLLRRLREVMAEPVSAQTRLDRIVVHIAANMVAEVCSVYVLRADTLTRALRHRGSEPRGRPSHDDARGRGPRRPDRADRGERWRSPTPRTTPPSPTGRRRARRSIPRSSASPMLRGGNTLGVLVVQNKARRLYNDEEVEVLQTTAMLLAEMIASGELQSLAATTDELAARRPLSLDRHADHRGHRARPRRAARAAHRRASGSSPRT